MISLLLPTYHRPDGLRKMVQSARVTADKPDDLEFVVYIDHDDDSYSDLQLVDLGISNIIKGPKVPISDMWNECQKVASGDIYMQAADDIIFTSQGWDTKVKEVFDRYEDKLVFVFGNDGHPSRGNNHGTHGFLHKRWVDTVGYFLPPGYVADWSDQWLNDVANALNRSVYVEGMNIEHLHPALGKGIYDKTYLEADIKRAASRPDMLYVSELPKREADINKLKEKIK